MANEIHLFRPHINLPRKALSFAQRILCQSANMSRRDKCRLLSTVCCTASIDRVVDYLDWMLAVSCKFAVPSVLFHKEDRSKISYSDSDYFAVQMPFRQQKVSSDEFNMILPGRMCNFIRVWTYLLPLFQHLFDVWIALVLESHLNRQESA